MIYNKRMARVEEAAAPAPARQRHGTSAEWLERLEQLGRDGYFDNEPDFPLRLGRIPHAIDGEKRSLNPPWERPKYFVYERTEQGPNVKLWDDLRNPRISKAADWLANMTKRVYHKKPPLTLAEYKALTDWFNANANSDFIQAGSRNLPEIVDLGDGRSRPLFDFVVMNRKGFFALETRELLDDLKKLKAQFDARDANASKLIATPNSQ